MAQFAAKQGTTATPAGNINKVRLPAKIAVLSEQEIVNIRPSSGQLFPRV
ncbi:MAG: hypothetical protein KME52_31860 [Desmonostoc geniculatum HA4340-LM1]|jgi:hypothetical protein|nr:hypothetical protein [Desmonostoc geniculatum HA4340-LM1]